MAFSAVLEIGDNTTRRYYKQFLLTDLCIVFNRSYNVIPTGAARCERLDIVVVAPGKEDLFMYDWFLRSTSTSGRIVISLSGDIAISDSDNQEIYFEDAQCFSLSEKYDIKSSRRRLLKMSIVSNKMTIGNLTFKCL